MAAVEHGPGQLSSRSARAEVDFSARLVEEPDLACPCRHTGAAVGGCAHGERRLLDEALGELIGKGQRSTRPLLTAALIVP